MGTVDGRDLINSSFHLLKDCHCKLYYLHPVESKLLLSFLCVFMHTTAAQNVWLISPSFRLHTSSAAEQWTSCFGLRLARPCRFWKGHCTRPRGRSLMHSKQYKFPLFVNAKNNNNELAFYCRALSGTLWPLTHGRLCRTNGANYRKWVRRVLETIGTVLSAYGKDVARSLLCAKVTFRQTITASMGLQIHYLLPYATHSRLIFVVLMLALKIFRNAANLPIHNTNSLIL